MRGADGRSALVCRVEGEVSFTMVPKESPRNAPASPWGRAPVFAPWPDIALAVTPHKTQTLPTHDSSGESEASGCMQRSAVARDPTYSTVSAHDLAVGQAPSPCADARGVDVHALRSARRRAPSGRALGDLACGEHPPHTRVVGRGYVDRPLSRAALFALSCDVADRVEQLLAREPFREEVRRGAVRRLGWHRIVGRPAGLGGMAWRACAEYFWRLPRWVGIFVAGLI